MVVTNPDGPWTLSVRQSVDCVIDRNPADSILAQQMISRHIEILARVPKQVEYDGGLASGSGGFRPFWTGTS